MQVANENAGVNIMAPSAKALSSGELKNLLGQCLKMASENKITSANTWGLPLIEHLDDLIKEGDDVDKNTNFQKASVTLDAGVKIYSYRVDSVHTETFKILGGLGRASGPGDDSGDPGDGGIDGENLSPSKRKRRNNELNPEATLEPTLEALNVKKFDLAFAVDPLFHKTSAQFDEGGARGLLLNNLSVYKGCEIVFDSMDIPERALEALATQPAAADAQIDLSHVQAQLEAIKRNTTNPSAARISPVLDEILGLLSQGPASYGTITEADALVQHIAEAAGDVRPMQPIPTFFPSTSGAAAPQTSHDATITATEVEGGAMAMETAGGAVYHSVGGDGYYDDSGDYGGYDDDDGADDYSAPGAAPSPTNGQHGHHHHGSSNGPTLHTSLDEDALQWLISAGNGNGTAPGNNGTYVTGAKGWAGASHWRYKSALPNNNPKNKSNGGNDDEEVDGPMNDGIGGIKKRSGGGSRRKNDPLDFVDLMKSGAMEPEFDLLPRSRAAKKAKPEAKTLLPEDHHYQPEMLARYALRPRNAISIAVGSGGSGDSSTGAGTQDGSGYDADEYNDGHGGAEFGDFDGGYDDDDDNDGDAYGSNGTEWDALFGFSKEGGEAGLQLVEAARKVDKVDVNYSKAAKQVDVRSLKELMWSGIQQVIAQKPGGELDLNEVLKTVPERNAAGRLEDLSVHLCFICVLHLANEHGLVVKGVSELDRLLISNVPEL